MYFLFDFVQTSLSISLLLFLCSFFFFFYCEGGRGSGGGGEDGGGIMSSFTGAPGSTTLFDSGALSARESEGQGDEEWAFLLAGTLAFKDELRERQSFAPGLLLA